MTKSALILAGHGSHISPNTAGVVWRYVDRLRALGAAAEVTACFWKEPPAFSQVMHTVAAANVFVVPVFTASGYFTRAVLPTEMALSGDLSRRDGKRITLTRCLGEHRSMTKVVQGIVRAQLQQYNLQRAQTAVAVIGHGTRRNANSRATTRYQAERLRELNWVREVVDVYLDDEPGIASIYQSTSADNIIALPYFLAPGSHVSIDVPRALGLSAGAMPQTVAGRKIYYTGSLSDDASVCSAIHDLALEAGLPSRRATQAAGDDPWRGFPQAGRYALVQALHALQDKQTLSFGPVLATAKRVWHRDNGAYSVEMTRPGQLRACLRDEPFRPLPTSRDLPAGWHVHLKQAAQAHAVLETIFPGLVADWARQRGGSFVTEPLHVTSERQVGMFKDLHKLAPAHIESAVAQVCGACLRQPTWWRAQPEPSLPCPAACNFWMSTAMRTKDSA